MSHYLAKKRNARRPDPDLPIDMPTLCGELVDESEIVPHHAFQECGKCLWWANRAVTQSDNAQIRVEQRAVT